MDSVEEHDGINKQQDVGDGDGGRRGVFEAISPGNCMRDPLQVSRRIEEGSNEGKIARAKSLIEGQRQSLSGACL